MSTPIAHAATRFSPIYQAFVSVSHQSPVTEKYEPSSGVYLGMFVKDSLTKKLAAQDGDTSRDARLAYAGQAYGKKPAIYLTYRNFYESFPTQFANEVKSLHGAVQIGWQPEIQINGQTKSLDYLFTQNPKQTKSYIRQFIADAKASGVPVFLRFASEMNGPWTPWHSKAADGSPDYTLFKKAWVEVWNEIQAQKASNVVMVFSPTSIVSGPSRNQEIMKFYPGDKYVDWIGESVYTFPYNPAIQSETLGDNIVYQAEGVYDLFRSHKKPFMISEGAAVSAMPDPWKPGGSILLPQKNYSDWATMQISNMMNIIPKAMPLVKAVTYFNESTVLADASPNDKNITYNVNEHKNTMAAFKNSISDSDYLSTINAKDNSAPNGRSFIPLSKSGITSGVHTVSPYITTKEMQPPAKVVFTQNGSVLASTTEPPWNLQIDFTQVSPTQPITITAYSQTGVVVAQGTFQVMKTHLVYVDHKVTLHTHKWNDGSHQYIDPQWVNVYRQTGNWYQIQTTLGPRWIQTPYVNHTLTLSHYSQLYTNPTLLSAVGGGVSPQTVHVIKSDIDWVEIQTWLGPKWLFLPQLRNELTVTSRTTLYGSADRSSVTYGTISPQSVNVLKGTGNWYEIQTWAGPKWIYEPPVMQKG
ncbi:glycosyl hydrolase [Alicyclobacillus sp. SO9]|uniref:glycosyl hydrolase n=1 Tax=Alicyclobacillus sp. SO9 TaxID=2665646 RepID=UPI0018E8EECC|nr:glycosyl hydrolase [Alicyclobacillus sp. SO9]